MFVKNILNGRITIPDKLKISLFKPYGLRKTIDSIPKQNYVLGVGYEEGDYQICISGRKKRNEKLQDTVSREMFEEISLLPKYTPQLSFNIGRNYFYKINISDTYIVHNKLRVNTQYDTVERVIICIHGTQWEIMDYLEKVNLDKYNCDNITHIWADKAENIMKYLK